MILRPPRSTLFPYTTLPISRLLAKREFLVNYRRASFGVLWAIGLPLAQALIVGLTLSRVRSEEHTSELQSHVNLVCRLLLEKKKNRIFSITLDFQLIHIVAI